MTNETVDTSYTFGSILAEAEKAQSTIDSKAESVSQHLFTLAQALTNPGQFEAGCVAAEQARKLKLLERAAETGLDKEARKSLVKLPSVWSNAKSVILRGWEDFTLIPNDYESYTELKAAKAAAVKEVRGGTRDEREEASDEATKRMDANDVTMVIFGELLDRIRALPTTMQEEISAELEQIITKYEDAGVTDADDTQQPLPLAASAV